MSKLSDGKDHTYRCGLGLNLRAYLDLPPRPASLEDEVLGVIDRARLRLCSREEAARAVLGIIGRETEAFEAAVRRTLGGGEGI